MITNSFGSVTSEVVALTVTGVTIPGVTLETLYSFTNNAVGCLPVAGLIQASDGNFYGTAAAGGAHGYGTIYRMTTNGAVSLIYTFANGSLGGIPFGALVQGTNGYLYATTSSGGNNGDGVILRTTTNGNSVEAWSLTNSTTGSSPQTGLVQGRDGNFYGTALYGGAYGYGTVFKLTASGMGVLTAFSSFNNENGAYPWGPLVQAPNGNFYCCALGGGTNDGWGTIFHESRGSSQLLALL